MKASFDLQPTLRGTLLELRPLRNEDFDALFAAASDPLIWEQHPDSERYKKDVFQENYFATAMESRGAFAVIERATGKIIGSSRYWNFKPGEDEVEIGWTFLERRYWGGEYNREMKSLMVEHALRFVERVVFVVGENNLRSQRAMEKIGGRLIGRSETTGRDGKPRKNVVFEIRRKSLE